MNYKQLRVIKIEGDIVTVKLVDTDIPAYSKRIEVVHDYVRLSGSFPFTMEDSSSAHVSVLGSTTIGIYDFYKFVLPFLNKHEYLQEPHANGLNDRGKINYAYQDCIIQFFDAETRTHKVAMRSANEAEFTIVSYEFYKHFILKQD